MRKNWKIEQLKDACEVFVDGNWIESKDQSEEGIRLIQTGNIGFGIFKNKDDKARFISEETFTRLKCTEILPGDLLVSRLPDPVGKSCIIPDLDLKMITGVDCTIIRTKEYLSSTYLRYFQMSNEYLKDVEGLVSGTTRSRISRKNLGTIEIPIPPLPEQKQIVAILDRAFAAIDQAKANIEKNIENAKELFQSKLNEIFSQKGDGSAKGADKWEEKTLGDVASLKGRIGWKGLTAKEYTDEGPLFLSVHSLNYGDYVDFRDAFHISDERYDESPEIMLKKGDVLICKDGAGIGKLGVLGLLPGKTTVNSSLLVIRGGGHIMSKYLYYSLLSPFFQKIVQNRLQGATTPHLYQRDITTFPIFLPPLQDQPSIIKTMDELNSNYHVLISLYDKKIENLVEIKKSILQKAFTGELTGGELKKLKIESELNDGCGTQRLKDHKIV